MGIGIDIFCWVRIVLRPPLTPMVGGTGLKPQTHDSKTQRTNFIFINIADKCLLFL